MRPSHSPRLEVALTTELQTRQRQLTEMQLSRIARINNGTIIHILEDVGREELHELAVRDDLTKKVMGNDGHKLVLEGVIARKVVQKHGDELAAFMREKGPESHDDITLDIEDKVRAAVRATLQDWKSTRERFAPTPVPDPESPHTFDQFMKLEGRYPTATFAPYERVRQAFYRAMTPDDVRKGDRPGPIQRSYDRAVIPPRTLRKAIKNDLPGFKKETEGGGFVNHSDKIVHELMRALSSRRQIYKGWLLETLGDGDPTEHGEEIEAWLTGDVFPDYPGQVRKYLNKGETGSMTFYNAPTTREHLMKQADRIIRFDTIRGDNRPDKSVKGPSGARLFPKYVAEVMRRNQSLLSDGGAKPKMMLYALRHLSIRPQNRAVRLPHLENYQLPLGSNLASPKFFTDRGFVDCAIDTSPGAPHALHYVDGEAYELRPTWVHLIGELDEIYRESVDIWRKIQWKHGDYSHDI